ncbi:MAG: hypothetical protein WCU80_12355 [Paludibacteraceae bacterium]
MKFDFTKAWEELSNDEQWNWDEKCKKSETTKLKKFAKSRGQDFEVYAGLLDNVNSKAEWNKKHIKVMRDACTAKYKPMLKSAQTLEEYDKIFADCAKELEVIGF